MKVSAYRKVFNVIKFRLLYVVLAVGTSVAWCNQLVAKPDGGLEGLLDTVVVKEAKATKSDTKRLVEFTGFIKYDLFADTRQVVNAREGLVSIYPENRLYDDAGRDINRGLNVNMLSIHSRLGVRGNGPVVLNARTSGLIEADFYGNANSHFSDLNGLRLFNAYIDFDWHSVGLRVGQDWHPMSVREFFPNTVSFSAGAPFHPMSRNPQLRMSYTSGGLKVIGAILSQRDFTSTGPDGPSSHYMRNAGMPNVHVQVQYGQDSTAVSGGVGIDHKRLLPSLSTVNAAGEVFKSTSEISSVAFTGFMKVQAEKLRLTLQGVYAQNAYDLLMLGGYAERKMDDAMFDEKAYANLDVASFWTDITTTWGKLNFGAFIGYTKNLGARKALANAFYSRGEDIGWIYRIAPRLSYTAGSIGIAVEGEYTSAGYGVINGNGYGNVTELMPVANFRSLISVKYDF